MLNDFRERRVGPGHLQWYVALLLCPRSKPGSTAGEGIKALGGEWYLVSSAEEKLTKTELEEKKKFCSLGSAIATNR
jgi:hypothetical protein